ncbi:MAG: two-component system, cell cycle response regulator [Chloroflexota bacterium]|nr:two-component system, cell cycle response regulator [Chloroflexota bacterium]
MNDWEFRGMTNLNSGMKYGEVKNSTIRNLFYFMLAFGLAVGTIFPFFAKIVLNTDRALSAFFISMCLIAGLLVGLANFLIFRSIVSRELKRVQQGMDHVNEKIATANVLEEECDNNCLLEITSADIIGDIERSFNDMTDEIFSRLELESETRAMNESLIKSAELVDVAQTILEKLCTVMDAKGGLLYGGSIGEMALLANYGVDKTGALLQSLGEGMGPVNQAFISGEILTFSDQQGWEWVSQSTPLGKFHPSSIILLPLVAKQRSVGLAIMACGSHGPNPEQMKKLEALRVISAPYLDNSMLHQKITELAALDDLTMILNRRFGMRRIREEFSRSARHGSPMSVMMIDIDHFKNFNDTFGHNAGDAVLKVVASILNANLRTEDMVCRYGGEEFLLLLSGAGMNDSAVIAERIRRVIETEEIKWGGSKLSISVSIGVATYPIVRASVCEELITYADKALYVAKEAGRNQVIVNDGVRTIPYSDLELANPESDKRKLSENKAQ